MYTLKFSINNHTYLVLKNMRTFINVFDKVRLERRCKLLEQH